MMHLFSFFGFENESHTRERRLIFDAAEQPEAPVPASSDEERGKRMDAVLVRLENLAAVQERREAALVEWQKRFASGKIPRPTPEGGYQAPCLHSHPASVACARSRDLRQKYESSIETRGGYTLPQESTDVMNQYTIPSSQSRGRARQMHPSALGHFYTQNPWVATSGRSYAARRAEPDPVHWSDLAAAQHVRDLGGNAIVTGANSVYIPKTVRTDEQNPYLPHGISPEGRTNVQNDITRHINVERDQRMAPMLEQYKDDPRAAIFFEDANRKINFSNGDPSIQNSALNLLEHQLTSMSQSDFQQEKLAGLTNRNVPPLHTEYINWAGEDTKREVRITTPKNAFKQAEEIVIHPNSFPLFFPDDLNKAIYWGIDVDITRTNSTQGGGMGGLAKGVTVYFRKPGEFTVNGKEVKAVGRSTFLAPIDRVNGEPDTIKIVKTRMIPKVPSLGGTRDATNQNFTQETIEIATATTDIPAGESRVVNENVTISRDTGGQLYVTFYDAGTYQVVGSFTDTSKPDVTATYNAMPKTETPRDRQLRIMQSFGPTLTKEQVVQLFKMPSPIELPKVTTMSQEAAEALAKYKGRLVLPALEWTQELAVAIAPFAGEELVVGNSGGTPVHQDLLNKLAESTCTKLTLLNMNAVTGAQANALQGVKAKTLHIISALSFDDGALASLVKFKGILSLPRVEALSDGDADQLTNFTGELLQLPSLKLSDEKIKVLAKYPDLKIQLGEKMTAKLLETKKALDKETQDSAVKSARTQFVRELAKVNEEIKSDDESYGIIVEGCRKLLGTIAIPNTAIVDVMKDEFGGYVISIWKDENDKKNGTGIATIVLDKDGGVVGSILPRVEAPNPLLEMDKKDALALFTSLKFSGDISVAPIRIIYPTNHLMWKLTRDGQSTNVRVGYETGKIGRELRIITDGASFTQAQTTEAKQKIQELLTTKVEKVENLEALLKSIEDVFSSLQFPEGTIKNRQDKTQPLSMRWVLSRGGSNCSVKIGYVDKEGSASEKELKVFVNSRSDELGVSTKFDPNEPAKIQDFIQKYLMTEPEKAQYLKDQLNNIDTTFTEINGKFPKDITSVKKAPAYPPNIIEWVLTRPGAAPCAIKIGYSSDELIVWVNEKPGQGGYSTRFNPDETGKILEQVQEFLMTPLEKTALLQERASILANFGNPKVKPGYPGYEKLLKTVGKLCHIDVDSTKHGLVVRKEGNNTFSAFLYERGAEQTHVGTVSFTADGNFIKAWKVSEAVKPTATVPPRSTAQDMTDAVPIPVPETQGPAPVKVEKPTKKVWNIDAKINKDPNFATILDEINTDKVLEGSNINGTYSGKSGAKYEIASNEVYYNRNPQEKNLWGKLSDTTPLFVREGGMFYEINMAKEVNAEKKQVIYKSKEGESFYDEAGKAILKDKDGIYKHVDSGFTFKIEDGKIVEVPPAPEQPVPAPKEATESATPATPEASSAKDPAVPKVPVPDLIKGLAGALKGSMSAEDQKQLEDLQRQLDAFKAKNQPSETEVPTEDTRQSKLAEATKLVQKQKFEAKDIPLLRKYFEKVSSLPANRLLQVIQVIENSPALENGNFGTIYTQRLLTANYRKDISVLFKYLISSPGEIPFQLNDPKVLKALVQKFCDEDKKGNTYFLGSHCLKIAHDSEGSLALLKKGCELGDVSCGMELFRQLKGKESDALKYLDTVEPIASAGEKAVIQNLRGGFEKESTK